MGFSLYCFYSKNENELISKSEMNINIVETEQKELESKNVITASNINEKSRIVSPLLNERDIFINPIPEIVTIKHKKNNNN